MLYKKYIYIIYIIFQDSNILKFLYINIAKLKDIILLYNKIQKTPQ